MDAVSLGFVSTVESGRLISQDMETEGGGSA